MTTNYSFNIKLLSSNYFIENLLYRLNDSAVKTALYSNVLCMHTLCTTQLYYGVFVEWVLLPEQSFLMVVSYFQGKYSFLHYK